MKAIDFGDAAFRVTIEDFDLNTERPEFSQLKFALTGRDWALHAPSNSESLGVVAGRLGRFVANAPVRHWGSFVGLKTNEDVVTRVANYGFGSSDALGEYRRWEISSAFARYSLSAQFDHNLGVEHAIAVRGSTEETLIWRTKSGEVFAASIPIEKFDTALGSFLVWAEIQIEGKPS